MDFWSYPAKAQQAVKVMVSVRGPSSPLSDPDTGDGGTQRPSLAAALRVCGSGPWEPEPRSGLLLMGIQEAIYLNELGCLSERTGAEELKELNRYYPITYIL